MDVDLGVTACVGGHMDGCVCGVCKAGISVCCCYVDSAHLVFGDKTSHWFGIQ